MYSASPNGKILQNSDVTAKQHAEHFPYFRDPSCWPLNNQTHFLLIFIPTLTLANL